MIIRPEAEADLANARDWYERQRAGLGASFLLCIEEVLERISRTAEMYRVVHHDIRRALTRRFPYAVYYRIVGNDVVVWASYIRTVIRASGSLEHNLACGTSTATGKPRNPSKTGKCLALLCHSVETVREVT